jgi:hypothetical protein
LAKGRGRDQNWFGQNYLIMRILNLSLKLSAMSVNKTAMQNNC